MYTLYVTSYHQILTKRRHKKLKLPSLVSRHVYAFSLCLSTLPFPPFSPSLPPSILLYPYISLILPHPLQGILQYVNKQLYLAENRQRLIEHQSKLDTTAMERSTHPIAQQFKVTH